jgi:pentose-5-phosphate-3-epimerase
MVCQAIRPYAKRGAAAVPIDVHLMVKPVDAPSPPSASMRSRAVP